MSDHARGDGRQSDVREGPDSDPAERIEAYETDEGLVLYDAENPLAWLQSTGAVSLEERR
ncbi:MAG: hypothetical protein ABEJ58_02830 [Halodesulfurarchaeum sp.]